MRTRCLTVAAVLCLTTTAAAQSKLPDGAVAQIGVHRLRAPSAILDSAFTPDGKTLVVAFETKDKQPNVILFDVATGLERKRLNLAGVRHIAMAQHKPRLLVDTNTGFEVWDLAKEKREQQWPYPKGVKQAGAIAISPDGSQAVAATGNLKNNYRRHDEGAQAVAATDKLLRWNADTGKALAPIRLPASEFPIETMQFTADGSKILTAESPSDGFYIRAGYEVTASLGLAYLPLAILADMVGPRASLLFNAASKIGFNFVFANPSPKVAIWDAKTGKKLSEFSNYSGVCAFSPDGSMAACSVADQRIDIIRLDRSWTFVGTVDSMSGRCAFTPDGKQLVVVSVDGYTTYTAIGGGSDFRYEFHGRTGFVWDLAGRNAGADAPLRLSPDGKLLAVFQSDDAAHPNNHMRFFDMTTGKPVQYATGHPDAVGGLAYSPDGRRLATFSGNMVFLHDAKTGAELRRWQAHKADILHIAFSPDGKILASCSYADICLCDPATGLERKRFADEPQSLQRLAFTSDGKRLISINENGVVQARNVANGKPVESPEKIAKGRVKSVDSDEQDRRLCLTAVSSNAEYAAYFQTRRGDEGFFSHLSHVPTGKKFSPLAMDGDLQSHGFSPSGKFYVVNLSPDEKTFAICVWETVTQREVVRYSNGPTKTKLLAISADGRILAHGVGDMMKRRGITAEQRYFDGEGVDGRDQAVVLRDLAAAKDDDLSKPRQIRGHLGPITCLAFSPDGKFLATGGADQVVYIWRVEHFLKPAAPPAPKGDVAALWPHLAGSDAGRAYQAISQLECRPKETIALLRKHLKPAMQLDDKVIAQKVRDLSSGNYTVRLQANSALEIAGEQATAHLKQALKNPASLEVKRRLESLLEKVDRPFEKPSQLRAYRCLIVLERIGTPEARLLLEELSRGSPSAWLTTEARHSLSRVP